MNVVPCQTVIYLELENQFVLLVYSHQLVQLQFQHVDYSCTLVLLQLEDHSEFVTVLQIFFCAAFAMNLADLTS